MQKRLRDFEIGLCTEPPKVSNGNSSYVVYWNEYRFEYTVEALLGIEVKCRM